VNIILVHELVNCNRKKFAIKTCTFEPRYIKVEIYLFNHILHSSDFLKNQFDIMKISIFLQFERHYPFHSFGNVYSNRKLVPALNSSTPDLRGPRLESGLKRLFKL
jgi:hypothetical protein